MVKILAGPITSIVYRSIPFLKAITLLLFNPCKYYPTVIFSNVSVVIIISLLFILGLLQSIHYHYYAMLSRDRSVYIRQLRWAAA
jgi:hypothetical protein